MRLGKVLRKYRLMSDLNVIQLANEIGISKQTLSRIEKGRKCDSETLGKILRWLLESDGHVIAAPQGHT